jgi:hypothetical protein
MILSLIILTAETGKSYSYDLNDSLRIAASFRKGDLMVLRVTAGRLP